VSVAARIDAKLTVAAQGKTNWPRRGGRSTKLQAQAVTDCLLGYPNRARGLQRELLDSNASIPNAISWTSGRADCARRRSVEADQRRASGMPRGDSGVLPRPSSPCCCVTCASSDVISGGGLGRRDEFGCCCGNLPQRDEPAAQRPAAAGTKAVDGLSFRVSAGRTVARARPPVLKILGPTCGKQQAGWTKP